MQNRFALRTSVAVLLATVAVTACRNIEPDPPPDAPRINSFTASKTRIAAGEMVTLSFATTGVTKVEVLDDSGQQLTLGGTVEAGTTTVAPTHTSFYVLRATGIGGRDTAFLQIAVNEPLKDVFLIPVPSSIRSGDQAQLLWGAAGASAVTLTTGTGTPVTLMGTTGAVTVTPATTEHYTLTAQGAPGTPALTALADVQVRPVLLDATYTAVDGVSPTKTVTFRWKTAGAAHVIVSEQTFGQLTDVTEPSTVVMGSYDWIVPAKLPSGIDVTDGLPLRFTITVTAGADSDAKVLTAVVGDSPVIDLFDAPAAATTGKTFSPSWRTLNATRVEVRIGALPIWASLPGEQLRVNAGTVALPAPSTQTDYTFVVSNDRGASVSRVFTVRPVNPPVITMFTLTPTITALGDSATARWTTTDAVRVQLRHENGASIANVTSPATVASGNLGLLFASSTRVVLEAVNAANDSVTLTRPFTFQGSVTLNPNPVVRGSMVTLDWALGDAGVIEVVGLPTVPPAPTAGSLAFVDLAMMGSTATEVRVQDPTDGTERIAWPQGFRFPLLGKVRDELWVSVNGFVAFANPGPLNQNSDFTAMANTAPTMLAPFWDDLTMTMGSKILTDLSVSSTGERFLIVQWEKMQIAGDSMSELTFQVHLYETGQVAFIYKTLTGTLTSVTIGVKDATWPIAQQYTYNSMMVAPSPGLELNYFTGGAPNGNLTFNAGPSQRLSFFGRTALSLMSAGADLRSFAVNDVTITEAMPVPEMNASEGQWLELKNNLTQTIDFQGLVVSSPGSVDGGFVIPEGTLVDAGAFLLLGQSTDLMANGGAPVALVFSDVPLANPGSARVSLGVTTLSSLAWDAGVAAKSERARDQGLLVATGQTFTCPRVSTFGPGGAFGSPGAANEPCAPYALSSIPGNFLSAPAGSDLVASSSDEGTVSFTLPMAFRYFGTNVTNGGLSTNGFISLGSTLSSATFTNPTTVSTTTPNGTVAPFWDDLVRDTGKNAMWRLSDRTVITWEGYRLISTTPADTQLNFQVHLLDTGVIEFHYGVMNTSLSTQSTIDRVAGNSATVWLERQDGVIAVPSSINQLLSVRPNSGLRFTPVP